MISRPEIPATSSEVGQKLDAAIALMREARKSFVSAGNGMPEYSAETIRSLIDAHALLANICLCAQSPALREVLQGDIVNLLEQARNQVGQNGIIELPPRKMPSWNPILRELRFDDVMIKQYRLPSDNQERVLNSFQEENWPVRIADPLPQGRIPVKQQLHDTIKSLNRNQRNERLRFLGDGTGRGVLWTPLQVTADVHK